MNARTVYVIGARGQLGMALLASAAIPAGLAVMPLTSDDIDLTDLASVRPALADLRPGDVVINAAAYTNVDAAESDEAAAYAVNETGAGHLAAVTAAVGARLVHVSTDYVFGSCDGPREPLRPADLEASGEPKTVYGASKLAGERAVLAADPDAVIVRTAWVFTGREPVRDFVTTMRRLAGERDQVQVVDDQRGSPTYAPDLAAGLWDVVDQLVDRSALDGSPVLAGTVLHATNAGEATWFDVARAVFEGIGADPKRVIACTSAEFVRPAPRPGYSVMSGADWTAAGLAPLRPWRAALAEALASPQSG